MIQKALKFIKSNKLTDTHFLLYDFSKLQLQLSVLENVFPSHTLHAVAVKSNPLHKVLSFLKDQNLGAECASWGECVLALSAGYDSSKIVYDSPCKTVDDLLKAIQEGVSVNCDSLDEWDRIASLLETRSTNSQFGLRLNSQVGTGNIEATSVVGEYSKFGIPVDDFYDCITSTYLEFPNLTSIHVHSGSQGCEMELLVKSIEKVYRLAESINQKSLELYGTRRIKTFNIGGGAYVSYHKNQPSFDMALYVKTLKSRCPNLFKEYQIITEFGRFVHAHNAIACSRVEYIKPTTPLTAVCHFGADLMLRACYAPDDWSHDIEVYSLKTISQITQDTYNIAGPLCFSGDILAKNFLCESLSVGDYLIFKDVGAYTFSMWSQYNSRFFPLCLGLNLDGDFEILREMSSEKDIVSFWS